MLEQGRKVIRAAAMAEEAEKLAREAEKLKNEVNR